MAGVSQVDQAAAAARERGDREELFGPGHDHAGLVRASYSAICESLAAYDINLLFIQPEIVGQNKSFQIFLRPQEPGMTYDEIVRRLGPYADPDHIVAHRMGVLPRGHNPIQGKTRFIIVTPTPDDYEPFRAELEQQIIHFEATVAPARW